MTKNISFIKVMRQFTWIRLTLTGSLVYMIVMAQASRRIITFEDRIIGGDFTVIQNFPYLVNLRQNGQFKCGGSIISHKCIITAAHCVFGISPVAFTIHAGATYLSDLKSSIRQVIQTFVPSTYASQTLDMDVAILKLNQSLYDSSKSSSSPSVRSISLCSKRPDDNANVQIIGWGVTEENSQKPSEQIQTAMVKILSMKDCSEAYGNQAHITATMLCASIPGEKDSCSGDSGGPLIYHNEICGIVSWGFGCARPQYPGVYTNIASLRVNAFIKTILTHNCF